MSALFRRSRFPLPGGGPARWTAVVLACAVLGALAGPALGDGGGSDRGDTPAQDESTQDESAQQEESTQENGSENDSEEDLGLPPGGDAQEGSRLYTQQCARCHGPAGRGGDLAPSLHGLEVARIDLVLRTNRMPPANQEGEGRGNIDWSDEQRSDILAYAAEAFGVAGSLPEPEPGDPAVGRELFAENCAACHTQTGGGGVAGAGAFTPGVTGLEPVTVAEAVRIGPFQMPQFGERQVSDEGLGHIAAYLEFVAEEQGTPLLGLVELNPVYASAFVALFALIVLASCVWLGGRVLMFPDPRRQEPEGDADQKADQTQEGNQP